MFHSNQKDLKPIDPNNPEAKRIHNDEVQNLLSHPKDIEFYINEFNNLI